MIPQIDWEHEDDNLDPLLANHRLNFSQLAVERPLRFEWAKDSHSAEVDEPNGPGPAEMHKPNSSHLPGAFVLLAITLAVCFTACLLFVRKVCFLVVCVDWYSADVWKIRRNSPHYFRRLHRRERRSSSLHQQYSEKGVMPDVDMC
jgi:hypothetical protein